MPWLSSLDHVAANLSIEKDDSELGPFSREGGLGKACLCLPERIARSQAEGRQVHQVFGGELNTIIEELNGALAA